MDLQICLFGESPSKQPVFQGRGLLARQRGKFSRTRQEGEPWQEQSSGGFVQYPPGAPFHVSRHRGHISRATPLRASSR